MLYNWKCAPIPFTLHQIILYIYESVSVCVVYKLDDDSICLPPGDLFHLAYYLLDSLTLLKMMSLFFLLLLLLGNVLLYISLLNMIFIY